MVESYWDLYVAYIAKCVRDNWANDIDPHHYRMEWNHFLPKSIFGDQPIGHWLTFRQHSIASALQSLAFKRNCMCPWHKSCLPPSLLKLAWPYFGNAKRGIPRSDETKRKLREANLGKMRSNETVMRHAESMNGRKWWSNAAGKTKFQHESPGPEWQQSRNQTGRKWWINAERDTKFQFESPGPEWQQSRKWKTNQ